MEKQAQEAAEQAGKSEKEVAAKAEDETAEKAKAAADFALSREKDRKARMAALDSAADEVPI